MATPARTETPTAAAPRLGAETSLVALASTGFRALRDYLASVFETIALESRLAGTTLALMAGIALGAALLALTAWGLLIAAGVLGLTLLGLSLGASLLIAAAVSAVIAAALAFMIPRLARRMTFATTRRLLARGKEHA